MNLQISRSSDYALRLAVWLTMMSGSGPIPTSELARSQGIPEAYLQKILPDLTKAKLVAARRGVHGGFTLARDPDKVSLLEVIEAVDGPVRVNVCVAEDGACPRWSFCPVHHVWCLAQKLVTALLSETTLSQVAVGAMASFGPAANRALSSTLPVWPAECGLTVRDDDNPPTSSCPQTVEVGALPDE